MNDLELRAEVNKRLTLNWLIQGAAQHAAMTAHHLVRDELDALNPKLLRLNDQFALIGILQYWYLDAVLMLGWPPRYWRKAATSPRHPFYHHPLLSRHGGMLAESAKKRAMERAKEKGVYLSPAFFMFQAVSVMIRLKTREARHQTELIELAKKTTSMVWKIPQDRLNATLTHKVAFGKLSKPTTWGGRFMRIAAIGYGGVVPGEDSLEVVARGTMFWVLCHELVKATAELICLHGLNTLDDETYQRVVTHADRIEYEAWMLPTGGELWRRLLALLPEDCPLSDMLMHLARLPAHALEALMLAVIEEPEAAQERLARLMA